MRLFFESIENDAEIDKEIQESTDFRGFLQETCIEIDLCLKEYVKNEQPGNSRGC